MDRLAAISDLHYGYTRPTWDEMVDVGQQFLADVARRRRLTTYTEFCQVIRQRAGTDMDTGLFALGSLLGDIAVAALRRAEGALVTSLITYLDDNRPGDGFFQLAQERGLLPAGKLSQEAKDEFWARQVALVYSAYAT